MSDDVRQVIKTEAGWETMTPEMIHYQFRDYVYAAEADALKARASFKVVENVVEPHLLATAVRARLGLGPVEHDRKLLPEEENEAFRKEFLERLWDDCTFRDDLKAAISRVEYAIEAAE